MVMLHEVQTTIRRFTLMFGGFPVVARCPVHSREAGHKYHEALMYPGTLKLGIICIQGSIMRGAGIMCTIGWPGPDV